MSLEQLLLHLRDRAGMRSRVVVRAEHLGTELGVNESELRRDLARLETAGFLKVLTPPPFLVLRLRSWSGEVLQHPKDVPPAYSHGKLSSNHGNESHRQSADPALLREILDTLGETDPTSFEGAIRHFAPGVIRKALSRVRRARSLRKNRTALFRYLLAKLS